MFSPLKNQAPSHSHITRGFVPLPAPQRNAVACAPPTLHRFLPSAAARTRQERERAVVRSRTRVYGVCYGTRGHHGQTRVTEDERRVHAYTPSGPRRFAQIKLTHRPAPGAACQPTNERGRATERDDKVSGSRGSSFRRVPNLFFRAAVLDASELFFHVATVDARDTERFRGSRTPLRAASDIYDWAGCRTNELQLSGALSMAGRISPRDHDIYLHG